MKPLTRDDLRQTLGRIDGRGYRAYQDVRGLYACAPYDIEIAHVQGDPYAPPSRVHVHANVADLGLDRWIGDDAARMLGFEDYLGRSVARHIRGRDLREISIDVYGQEILRRSAVRILGPHLEVRLSLHLPAAGRRVLGRQAARILLEDLPGLLRASVEGRSLLGEGVARHQDAAQDHAVLVTRLRDRGWIGFVADGSILPRRAGDDDRPLQPNEATPVVRFRAPETLAAEIDLPHAGRVRGLPIEPGVTLLVGGGFHGKSTLLDAIARGIYPHIPGDGREQVAAHPGLVKVRAEGGRSVTCADIRPFIGELPFGRSTRSFSTPNASGSTSQAAGIIEAIEAGAGALLLDEDTSATNFMIRDEPMRRLLKPGQEPITPFLDRVRNLYRDRGVSTVLVVGGSGEYFRVADRVIQMDRYQPHDVTDRARSIAPPGDADPEPFPPAGPPRRLRLDAYRRRVGPRGPRVKVAGRMRILVEREELDVSACEQLVSLSQVRLLAAVIERLLDPQVRHPAWARLGEELTPVGLRAALEAMGEELLEAASAHPRGDLAMVRPLEIVAGINRLRQLSAAGARDGVH